MHAARDFTAVVMRKAIIDQRCLLDRRQQGNECTVRLMVLGAGIVPRADG
jgi:hypothetical protein